MKFQSLKISPASLKSNNVKSSGSPFEMHFTKYILANYTILELDSEESLGLRNFPWTFPRLSIHGVVKAFSSTQSDAKIKFLVSCTIRA